MHVVVLSFLCAHTSIFRRISSYAFDKKENRIKKRWKMTIIVIQNPFRWQTYEFVLFFFSNFPKWSIVIHLNLWWLCIILFWKYPKHLLSSVRRSFLLFAMKIVDYSCNKVQRIRTWANRKVQLVITWLLAHPY